MPRLDILKRSQLRDLTEKRLRANFDVMMQHYHGKDMYVKPAKLRPKQPFPALFTHMICCNPPFRNKIKRIVQSRVVEVSQRVKAGPRDVKKERANRQVITLAPHAPG